MRAYMAGWCYDAGYAFAPTRLDHADAGRRSLTL